MMTEAFTLSLVLEQIDEGRSDRRWLEAYDEAIQRYRYTKTAFNVEPLRALQVVNSEAIASRRQGHGELVRDGGKANCGGEQSAAATKLTMAETKFPPQEVRPAVAK
jgi:hypothetical protein